MRIPPGTHIITQKVEADKITRPLLLKAPQFRPWRWTHLTLSMADCDETVGVKLNIVYRGNTYPLDVAVGTITTPARVGAKLRATQPVLDFVLAPNEPFQIDYTLDQDTTATVNFTLNGFAGYSEK